MEDEFGVPIGKFCRVASGRTVFADGLAVAQ
jgi:hypothetical protein